MATALVRRHADCFHGRVVGVSYLASGAPEAERVKRPPNPGGELPEAGLDLRRVPSPIQAYLERVHTKYAELRDGEVARYIPELAKANPEWFGICLATTDGKIYEAGDTRQTFTIQSISKPFVYGLALEDVGREAVLKRIGVEPSGEAFNSISLAPGTGCPLNPMINAGAIAATSLVAGRSPADRLYRLLAVLSLYAGRALSIDRTVYESERETGHRNRAIGHMLRNFDVLTDDPDPALDLYFQQCSIAVDCRDLSLMAATLANGGVNPLTGERVVRDEFVESILSIMTTCGMYDSAGEWVYSVGLPAKSGVAGGIIAVLPGQLGVGVFSPRLDAHGNSRRGIAVCQELSRDFNLHFLRVPRSSRSAIRAQYTAAEVSSKRLRATGERKILDAIGNRVRVYDLQGDLGFSAIEAVVRRLVEGSVAMEFAIVDLKRVTRIEESGALILLDLLLSFADAGKGILFVGIAAHPQFMRRMEERLSALDRHEVLHTFSDVDPALEWCENRLIAERRSEVAPSEPLTLGTHELCRGLVLEEIATLESLLQRRRFDRGSLIVHMGDSPDTIYLLLSGQVSVTVDLPSGQFKRLATLSAGMTFGELAVVDRTKRSADVRADTPVECYALPTTTFDALGKTHPTIKLALLENLLRNVARMLTRLNQEVTTLAR